LAGPIAQFEFSVDSDRFEADSEAGLTALLALKSAATADEAWAALITYSEYIGADLLSYHHCVTTPQNDSKVVEIRAHGFPPDWVKTYEEERLYTIDPIQGARDIYVRPVRWSGIEEKMPLTSEQAKFLIQLRSWLKGDGLGVPCFGPSGRSGYLGIGRKTRGIEDWDMIIFNMTQWVAQSFHLRMCELAILNMPADIKLSQRETEILRGLATGMSDEVICGLVGAQLHSVRSSIRKIMEKMQVSDRPSAVLRAQGAGLLDTLDVKLAAPGDLS